MDTSVAPLIEQLVDTDRYPLARPDSPAWADVVDRVRRDLDGQGCSVLPNFVRSSRHGDLRREGAGMAPHAHYDVETVNAYNIPTDAPLPADHPGRITMRRRNAFVAKDHVPPDSILGGLYSDGHFQRFLAACFDLPEIHELADPLAGLVLNVVRPGMDHPWHFDTNEFAVTLLTQAPEAGGEFEYCPGIRSAGDENFADVSAVLRGEGGDLVHTLTLRPGDLQLFRGRFSLHRVTPVTGDTDRHSAIFAYSARPGVIGSVSRTRQIFGRVLPEHLAAEGHAVRGDQLLD
ncbi:HalD/BesD family halogenase [Saccharomonospora halophila]|uniref:HalD/BesD family halogenase n=1 Tax=Saccharomonospora halophila TaxID=129922 RepID=UPI00037940B0|nr:hypothetical protein [Saccharomonospora halophila]